MTPFAPPSYLYGSNQNNQGGTSLMQKMGLNLPASSSYSLGALISGLGNLFGGDDPSQAYQAAQDQANKYYGMATNTQQPFYNAGTGAIPQYQQYLQQMSNPTGFINNIMSQYQESPWAKFQQQEAQRANNNMASAAGLIGSTPWQRAGEDYARNISSQDQNQFLQNVLGVNTSYGSGLNNLLNYGANAGNILSQLYGQQANTNANMAYGGAAADQNQNQSMWGLLGTIPFL